MKYRRLTLVSLLLILLTISQTSQSGTPIVDNFSYEKGSTYSFQYTHLDVSVKLNDTVLWGNETIPYGINEPFNVTVLNVEQIDEHSYLDAEVVNITYALQFDNNSLNPTEGHYIAGSLSDGWFENYFAGLFITAIFTDFFDPLEVDFSESSVTQSEDQDEFFIPNFTTSNETVYTELYQKYLDTNVTANYTGNPSEGFTYYNVTVDPEVPYNSTLVENVFTYNKLNTTAKTFEMRTEVNITKFGDFNGTQFSIEGLFNFNVTIEYSLGFANDMYLMIEIDTQVDNGSDYFKSEIGLNGTYLGINNDISTYLIPSHSTTTSLSTSTVTPTIFTTSSSLETSTSTALTFTTTAVTTTTSPITSLPPTTSSVSTDIPTTSDIETTTKVSSSSSELETSDDEANLDFLFLPVFVGLLILARVRMGKKV